MITLILAVAVVMVGLMGLALYRAAQKVAIYEDFCEVVLLRVTDILAEIRAVDIRGAFEADDEVGTVYRAISDLIQTLEEFLPTDEDVHGA